MTMQNNINIVRRNIRRDVLQSKLQTFPREVDNQRPIRVPIAIPAHNGERRTDRLQIIADRRLANIAQMPDFIRACRQIKNRLWKFVMRIGQHKNPDHGSLRKARTQEKKQNLKPFLLSLDISAWDGNFDRVI
jgi:hypothetical protein